MSNENFALTLVSDYDKYEKIAQVLVKSGFCQDAKDVNQAMFKIAWGIELGLGPIAAMQGIYIERSGGTLKPVLTANLMWTIIKGRGAQFYKTKMIERSAQRSAIEVTDKRTNEAFLYEFTWQDVITARLDSKDTFKRYPANMLFNRNVSNIAKGACADLFGGAPVYTPEEMGAEVDEEGNPTAITVDTRGTTDVEVVQPEGAVEALDNDLIAAGKLTVGKRKEVIAWARENAAMETAQYRIAVASNTQTAIDSAWELLCPKMEECLRVLQIEDTETHFSDACEAVILDAAETERRRTAPKGPRVPKGGSKPSAADSEKPALTKPSAPGTSSSSAPATSADATFTSKPDPKPLASTLTGLSSAQEAKVSAASGTAGTANGTPSPKPIPSKPSASTPTTQAPASVAGGQSDPKPVGVPPVPPARVLNGLHTAGAKPAPPEPVPVEDPSLSETISTEVQPHFDKLMAHVQSTKKAAPDKTEEAPMLVAVARANGWDDLRRGLVMQHVFGVTGSNMATTFTWDALIDMAHHFATTAPYEVAK